MLTICSSWMVQLRISLTMAVFRLSPANTDNDKLLFDEASAADTAAATTHRHHLHFFTVMLFSFSSLCHTMLYISIAYAVI